MYRFEKPPNRKIRNTDISELSKKIENCQGGELSDARHDLLWKLMASYIPANKESIQVSFVNHLEYTLARSRFSFDKFSAYLALSYSIRDRLIELFNDTQEYFIASDAKQVYFVSPEFLLGRSLRNTLLNLEMEDLYRESLEDLDLSIDSLYDEEYDPGLGAGGIGRMAACFMDSIATMNFPGWGYGLMYNYGMFKQIIKEDGGQDEVPDYWLSFGDPWRIQKQTVVYQVHFFGDVVDGVWKSGLTINAVANDFLIPGFATDNTLGLRLWSSEPNSELDEENFYGGDYFEDILLKQRCQNLTSVLYPNIKTKEGMEMRFMQEYFLSSATLQDIINRLRTQQRKNIRDLPSYAAIHLNDSHPAIMIAELLRILIDEENIALPEAVEISQKVFSCSCHAVIQGDLEKWDIDLFRKILPRHLLIIYNLNQYYLDSIRRDYPHVSIDVIRNISIIEETSQKKIRMVNLAFVGSHMMNSESKLHNDIMKNKFFKDFYSLHQKKFCNVTSGVSIRRWLYKSNPVLSNLISKICSLREWIFNTNLTPILNYIDDIAFIQEWNDAKNINKKRLTQYIQETTGVVLSPDIQLFDVQLKSVCYNMRQQLNLLSIVHKYLKIKGMTLSERQNLIPRAYIFGGKAAPGCVKAKALIKLINNIAKVINDDNDIGDLLKVVFIPNYNVTVGEIVIPGSDICEQIAIPGCEASGTTSLKFALNGCLIIGSFNGVNKEIEEAIGLENMFSFGVTPREAEYYLKNPTGEIPQNLKDVINIINSGFFGDAEEYSSLIDSITNNDCYLVARDFDDYNYAQDRCDIAYKNKEEWVKMCIFSTANMSSFSSDRAITEYATKIWNIKEYKLPINIVQENLGNKLPSMGVGSISGSLRRHQTATMKPGEVMKAEANRKDAHLPPIIGTKSKIPDSVKSDSSESDGSDEIPIDFS